jgi:hypothetical protein
MWTDSLIARIERAKPLDWVGRKLGLAFANVVRPGRAKDLLAGTWLGHPAHPMLTTCRSGRGPAPSSLIWLVADKPAERPTRSSAWAS